VVRSQNDLAMAIDQRHHSRQQSDSTYVRLGHNDGLIGNGHVYSDDSDVDPLDRYTGFSKKQQTSNSTRADSHPRTVSQITAQPHTSVLTDSDPQLTSAEMLAQTLQHTLTPAPPDRVTALSTVARQSVAAIVTAVQSHDPSARPSSQNLLEDRILASVVALRHLLYVSSPPYGHVPSHLYRKDGPASGPSIPQSLQAQLKPAQRRVTATLSKLVLAALAAQYDTISLTSEVSERMETDAAELDRALVTFVNEVQKIHNQMPQPPSRRLFATLLPTNVGLGLMGAGAAAGWKGLGWAPVDSLRQPKLDLSSEVLAELKVEIAELEERLVDLHSAVFDGSAGEPLRIFHMTFFINMCALPACTIHPLGQSAVAWLHSVLSFFADINLARMVDVDGIGREGHSGDVYLQSVQKARTLARTFEAQLQSLYDDGASVLLAITTPASLQSSPTSFPSERVRSLVASLKINVAQAFQTLEALLSVGQEQVAKGPSDHRGSIEWRMSRIVNIDSNLERTLKELASEDESYDEGGEDLVDMEHAFARKPAPLKTSLERSQSASAMYSNPSQTSESSLEPPHVHSEDSTPLTVYPDNNMTAIPSPPSLPGSDVAAESLEDEGINDRTVFSPII
jgi:son of sevenless-like protein